MNNIYCASFCQSKRFIYCWESFIEFFFTCMNKISAQQPIYTIIKHEINIYLKYSYCHFGSIKSFQWLSFINSPFVLAQIPLLVDQGLQVFLEAEFLLIYKSDVFIFKQFQVIIVFSKFVLQTCLNVNVGKKIIIAGYLKEWFCRTQTFDWIDSQWS